MNKHQQFLDYVCAYVEANPDVSPEVTMFAKQGLENALARNKEEKARLETALGMSLMRRIKSNESFLVEQLVQINKSSGLDFSVFIEALTERVKG